MIKQLFENLNTKGITVREYFTCCNTCGFNDIRNYKKDDDIGFCFYHYQAAESASETGELHLNWGHFTDQEYTSDPLVRPYLVVVNIITQEILSLNMTYEWDGDNNSKIVLTNLDKSYFQEFLDRDARLLEQLEEDEENETDDDISEDELDEDDETNEELEEINEIIYQTTRIKYLMMIVQIISRLEVYL